MYRYLGIFSAFTLILAGNILADTAPAEPVEPKTVACKVTTISPGFSSFFGLLMGKPPVVNDEVEIALDVNEITDITFKSGHVIPLKKTDTKLVKVGGNGYQSYFEGTHKSATSDYIGVLNFYHAEKESTGTLQILRKRNLGEMELHSLQLACKPL